MSKYEIPEDEVLEVMRKLDIRPEGYAVRLVNDHTIVLLHHKTRHEVIISKGDTQGW